MKDENIVMGAFTVSIKLSVVRRDNGLLLSDATAFRCVVVPTVFYYHSLAALVAQIKNMARIKYVHKLHREMATSRHTKRMLSVTDWTLQEVDEHKTRISPLPTEELRLAIYHGFSESDAPVLKIA